MACACYLSVLADVCNTSAVKSIYIQRYNRGVSRIAVPAALALAAVLSAQTNFYPLKDLKPGMRATGRTVFSGDHVEDFQVEILGVLEK